MAEKKIYGSFFGPYLYDDAELLGDPDGDFPSMYWNASVSDGLHICAGIRFLDTDQSNHLTMKWNEDAGANYDLNLLVGGATRSVTIEADSIISQDYSTDSATVVFAKLELTRAATLLLDLNPGFTGTGVVVDITPSVAIGTVDAEWDGIKINGSNLTPTEVGVHIDGIIVDFSSVGVGELPHLDGLHVLMPPTYHREGAHAIHTNHGTWMNYDVTTAAAGNFWTGFNIVIDQNGATGGGVHAIDVADGGGGSAEIVALGTHKNIDVIHQHIGTPTEFDHVWEFNNVATYTDITTACSTSDPAGANNVAIWETKDHSVYFGRTAGTFDEIPLVFETVATKNMHFEFYYSTVAGWTQFYPADDTLGATGNGSIRFTASALTGFAARAVNGETHYWIQVKRIRTSGTGPTEDTIKYLVATTYSWSKLGVITSLSLSTGAIGCGAITSTGLLLDSGATPAESQLSIKANSLGALEGFVYAADNVQLLFDAKWTGSAMLAADTSVARIVKNADDFAIEGGSSQTIGEAASFTQHLNIDLATGLATFSNNIVLPDDGIIGVTDGSPQILFDNTDDQIETTGYLVLGGDLRTDRWESSDTNTYLGAGVCGVGNASGAVNNTVLGYQAFNSITSGDSNVILGYRAGYFSTTAIANIFIGQESGAYNNEGTYNVCIGFQSGIGTSAQAYSNDVFIGYQAGNKIETGGYNAGIGSTALWNITTGSHNMGLGSGALYSLATGDYCVGIGRQALYYNTGSGNTGIGYNAGFYNASGVGNVIIGYRAAEGATGQNNSNNTVIGYGAALAITTGGNNVLVGYGAGNVLTTGSGNIVIGYDIDPSANNATNEINIGGVYKGDTNTTVPSFGTYAALDGESVAGYITIKDLAGNDRKVAVVA